MQTLDSNFSNHVFFRSSSSNFKDKRKFHFKQNSKKYDEIAEYVWNAYTKMLTRLQYPTREWHWMRKTNYSAQLEISSAQN